jgi:hypothetical protein
MGQIQNAVNGAVSSIVGAAVASELKTQRLAGTTLKDINTVKEKVDDVVAKQKEYDESVKIATQSGKLGKMQGARLDDYVNKQTKVAFDNLKKSQTQLQGWKTRVQQNIDILKQRDGITLDLERAITESNEHVRTYQSEGYLGKGKYTSNVIRADSVVKQDEYFESLKFNGGNE